MANDNTVTMALNSYNALKAENVRFQMLIQRICEGAELSPDYLGIDFDTHMIAELMHIMYPDQYKKKLATLRGQQTKLSLKKLELMESE